MWSKPSLAGRYAPQMFLKDEFKVPTKNFKEKIISEIAKKGQNWKPFYWSLHKELFLLTDVKARATIFIMIYDIFSVQSSLSKIM